MFRYCMSSPLIGFEPYTVDHAHLKFQTLSKAEFQHLHPMAFVCLVLSSFCWIRRRSTMSLQVNTRIMFISKVLENLYLRPDQTTRTVKGVFKQSTFTWLPRTWKAYISYRHEFHAYTSFLLFAASKIGSDSRRYYAACTAISDATGKPKDKCYASPKHKQL